MVEKRRGFIGSLSAAPVTRISVTGSGRLSQLLKMVLADDAHSARLRPFFSHLLDESDFGADSQMVEGVIENAVAVKKDLAAIGGFDEPMILACEKFRHVTVIFHFMRLYLTAHFANGVLNLTLRRAEGVLRGHGQCAHR